MDKSFLLSTPIVVHSLDISIYIYINPFRPKGDNKELFALEEPYLSAIRSLMYLTNCTKPNIAFANNLLARHSFVPTKGIRGVLNTLHYLKITVDLVTFCIVQIRHWRDIHVLFNYYIPIILDPRIVMCLHIVALQSNGAL